VCLRADAGKKSVMYALYLVLRLCADVMLGVVSREVLEFPQGNRSTRHLPMKILISSPCMKSGLNYLLLEANALISQPH
jgi:hypothetical protein